MPGRLTTHEDLLVGGQVRVQHVTDSFDDSRDYHGAPSGTSEWDTELDLFTNVRVARYGQLGVVVPFLETWRSTPTASSHGGGLGDVRLTGRWDFTRAGASKTIPGIGLLAGFTFPTGRPPEEASDALAAGATGRGAFAGTIGVGVEQSFGPWLVLVQELLSKSFPRSARGVRETIGLQSSTIVAVTYSFEDDSALGGFATFDIEGNSTIDGVVTNGTGSSLATFGLAYTHPFSDKLRIQSSLSSTPPISGFGRGRTMGPAFAISLVRGWS
jgi:hypothetical protein